MKKKYPLKLTKKQLEIVKCYWSMLQAEINEFYSNVGLLEKDMCVTTKIDGLEFFECDGEFVGVGNIDRTMELIQRPKLEKK